MLWFKFSILILTLNSQLLYANKFSSQQCLESKFSTEINNEGRFFGLLKNKLTISKDFCLIEVTFKEVLETKWKIDICRQPIHMKITENGSQEVFKRLKECTNDWSSDFCVKWKELSEKMQDYGLIFAKGERENIETSHGQVYCSFLLLKNYLDAGKLFSKFDSSVEIFDHLKSDKNCELKPNKIKAEDKPIPAQTDTQEIEIIKKDEVESF